MKSTFFSPSNAYRCGILLLTVLLVSQASGANSTIKPRIIGGSDATLEQFPWQVGIYTLTTDTQNNNVLTKGVECGGSIVHPRWILTAAHCFEPYQSNQTGFIMAGSIDQYDIYNNTVNFKSQIKRWILHPSYNASTVDNDIALIELETEIDLTRCGNNCQVIELITNQNIAAMAIPATATASGWGDTVGIKGSEDYPSILKYVDLNIQDCLASPSQYTGADITKNMFCASVTDYSKDTCQGDSGGPLVVANTNGTGKLLAGIVSWGLPNGNQNCANQNLPGVYTKIANYTDWIKTRTHPTDTGVGANPNGTIGSGAINLLWLFAMLVILKNRRVW